MRLVFWATSTTVRAGSIEPKPFTSSCSRAIRTTRRRTIVSASSTRPQNHVDDAISQFESALPGTDSIRDLVLLHLRKGDLAQYQAQMLRAADDQPTDADIQEELGEIYETIHRPADASHVLPARPR